MKEWILVVLSDTVMAATTKARMKARTKKRRLKGCLSCVGLGLRLAWHWGRGLISDCGFMTR